MRRQGRAARHHRLDPAAQPLADLGEDELVKEGRGLVLLDALLEEVQLAVEAPVEQQALDEAAVLDLGGDARVDAVKHAGHADEHGGPERSNVLHQLGDVSLPVADAAAHVQEQLLVHAVKDVRQGQVRQDAVRWRPGDVVVLAVEPRVGHARHHGAVLEHDTLGVTCGARGVHDGAQVLRGGRHWVSRLLRAQLDQLLV
mmetsp:Transcript_14212/g.35081  ORF Transcript_14212/g.35081 Transcript_14212/m.35081 type:complete len:200 (-) Transcript_14212:646-1245(-)